jgi:hypothetical protein
MNEKLSSTLLMTALCMCAFIPNSLLSSICRCFPHTINTCCSHIVDECTDADLVDSAEAFVASIPHYDPDKQSFEEACKRDPIALGRDVVRALRVSGQRRELFTEVIKDGNEKRHFIVGNNPQPVTLPQLQLLRDVKTRWDSVYFMIRRLRVMRPVSRPIIPIEWLERN